jgi:hypothetical protein
MSAHTDSVELLISGRRSKASAFVEERASRRNPAGLSLRTKSKRQAPTQALLLI